LVATEKKLQSLVHEALSELDTVAAETGALASTLDVMRWVVRHTVWACVLAVSSVLSLIAIAFQLLFGALVWCVQMLWQLFVLVWRATFLSLVYLRNAGNSLLPSFFFSFFSVLRSAGEVLVRAAWFSLVLVSDAVSGVVYAAGFLCVHVVWPVLAVGLDACLSAFFFLTSLVSDLLRL